MEIADVRRAVYLTVHEFPKRRGLNSVESAALLLGRSAGTVYNKADPGNETQDLCLHEAVPLMVASGDFRILHAIAAAVDHVAVCLSPLRQCSDAALLDLVNAEAIAYGSKAAAMKAALDDGRIDADELLRIKRTAYNQVRATLELLNRLEGIADAAR